MKAAKKNNSVADGARCFIKYQKLFTTEPNTIERRLAVREYQNARRRRLNNSQK